MSFVITLPIVSIPSDSGVTSSNKTSFTSPVKTPPWIAAPIATTSSGLTPFDGFFPKKLFYFRLNNWNTSRSSYKNTSSISEVESLASSKAFFTGANERFTNLSDNCSNLALVKVSYKMFGPEGVAVT